jgi:hypothetical protein
MLRPEYLSTENNADSPWAGRHDRLDPSELRKY